MKRNTKQGEVILSAIKSAGRPLTPLEIHELASKNIPRLGIATTYRHLRTLSETNQVVGVDYPGQPPRYEWADGQDKVHFACRSCDKLFALEDTTEDTTEDIIEDTAEKNLRKLKLSLFQSKLLMYSK